MSLLLTLGIINNKCKNCSHECELNFKKLVGTQKKYARCKQHNPLIYIINDINKDGCDSYFTHK
jgi:hypothetical protein